MAGLESTFALWTERQLKWGVREVSVFFLYVGLIMVLVQGVMVRRMSRRYGEGVLVVMGSLMMSLGFAMVLIVYTSPLAFVGGALIAIGFGLANPALSALISRNSPDEQQGAVMGASQSVQSLCRIIGPVVGAVILFAAFLIAFRALKVVRPN